MKAELKPLLGKYYGSQIAITLDDGSKSEIEVWIHDKSYTPSKRELEGGGHKTVEEARADDYFCDQHFESDVCHEICVRIVNALNTSNTQAQTPPI